MLARYSISVGDLENDFLRIEELADQLFTASVEGMGEFDLTTLTDQNGSSFDGLDESSTWILALRCGGCISPAPIFLAVIE